jgi:hypothetical protein
VINDNGGAKVASDFPISVTGTNVNPNSFNGVENPGTTVALDAGSYGVTETTDPGYTHSYSADCTGSIAIGETKTCTITNNDKPAVIKGTKYDDHDLSGSRDPATEEGLAGWTIFVDINDNNVLDAGEPFAITDASGNFTIDVNAGTFKLKEVMQSGWSQTEPASGVYEITITNGQTITGKNFGNISEHEGTMGFWKNWNRHNKYTQVQINGWLADLNASSAWLMSEAGYAANTTGMVTLINDATKDCGNKTDKLLCAKRKFLAQYMVMRLDVLSGRKSLTSTYNLSAFSSAMSYLGISPTTTNVTMNQLITKIEAKASALPAPDRTQFLNIASVCDHINNTGI